MEGTKDVAILCLCVGSEWRALVASSTVCSLLATMGFGLLYFTLIQSEEIIAGASLLDCSLPPHGKHGLGHAFISSTQWAQYMC